MEKLDAAEKSRDDYEKVDESTVVDYTNQADSDNENSHIRLRTAINVSKLLERDGVFLDPEIDTEALDEEEKGRSYFLGADENIEDLLNTMYQDDSDDGDDSSPFERKAAKMTNLLPDGGVKKKLLSAGLECDGSVPDKATVTIQYSLSLESQDEPFDSTYVRGRSERYKVDEGALLPGLEIAIKSMKKREKSEFLIEPQYYLGSMGCPPRIPGDAQVLAVVEMLDFVQEGLAEALLALMPEERGRKYDYEAVEKVAAREHTDGNNYTIKEEWKLAAKRYERGCKLLEDADLPNDDVEKRQQRLLMKLYLNRAHCYIKIQWPKKACLVLQDALVIEPKNAKALYRMGRAKRMLCNFAESRRYLVRALNVEPNDETIGRELADLDKQLKREQDNERALCSRMFGASVAAAAAETQSKVDSTFKDEEYEDIVEQLNEFKKNSQDKELVLPTGFSLDELRVIRSLVTQLNLQLEPVEGGRNPDQWKVVK